MPGVNWAAAERKKVDEGEYEATVTKCEIREKRNSDDKQVNVTFNITEPGPFKGTTQFRSYDLTEKALWALRTDLMELGADEDDFPETDDEDEFLASVEQACNQYFTGSNVTIEIKHNPDRTGKTDKAGDPVTYANIVKVRAL